MRAERKALPARSVFRWEKCNIGPKFTKNKVTKTSMWVGQIKLQNLRAVTSLSTF